ncbi:hypothetical protein BKA70DRAFT_1113450 [Coprinopsis sp. MPI-PUGE-AT-0042]|nr:hypothetical protein BKA70DRAFT_1113450 [Coprinopsis sp. MPI-PUGE-AT-0042]
MNQDLVDTIIDHYASSLPQWKHTLKKRRIGLTLSMLLTTSKTFFEATSSHLWRELSSIMPLFDLLPQGGRGEYASILMRPIKREDLTRWKVYAHHVRVIILQPKEFKPSPSVQTLAMLLAYQAATGDLLFPALQHLHFRDRLLAEELICLTALIPPSLEGLHLEALSASKLVLEAALQHAVVALPQLRCLTLQATSHLESLWPILHQLTVLRSLNLTIPYTPDDVESFCSLSALQEGTLYMFPTYGSPSNFVSEQRREHHDLLCMVKTNIDGREIFLSGAPFSLVSAIPAAARHGATNLQVESTDSRHMRIFWQELLDVISISCSSVSSLSLLDQDYIYDISLGTLWKVMALDNLQSLTVTVACDVESAQAYGPDQIFHRICLSAKHKATPLTKLRMHRFSGEYLGLASLQHVAEHLPHLLDLELSLDSSLYYEAPEGPFVGTPLPRLTHRHPMKVLRLKDLRSEPFKLQEYRTIALLINYLFPDLGCLEATGPSDGWGLIGDMRRDYQYLGNANVQGAVLS